MSTEDRDPTLEERVARLERLVAELSRRPPPPRSTSPRPGAQRPGAGTRPAAASPAAAPPPREDADLRPAAFQWDTDKLLGVAGVLFVLLAFAFLLKLSFERGWITPALRLAAGGVSGVLLLGLGLRLEESRRRLAQALMGGGLALFYLVTYAGSQIYGFFPPLLAISFMSTTTLLAFVLAERQDAPGLGVLAVAGGLATPWILQVGSESGVAVYLTLVLLGGAALYVHRGWTALLVTLVAAGWLGVGGHALQLTDPGPPTFILLATYWASTVALPLVRPVLRGSNGEESQILLNRAAVVWGSAATLLVAIEILSLGRTASGTLFLGLALAFALLAVPVRRVPASFIPAVEAAALSLAMGLTLITWGVYTPLVLALEAAALLLLHPPERIPTLATIAHALVGVAAVAFVLQSVTLPGQGILGLHEGALPHLAFLAVVAVAARWAGSSALLYRLGAYMGLLVWLLMELAPRPEGQALVSIAWALQGAAALVVSRIRRNPVAQTAGLATLALVAAKLLLVDLSQLDPLWRIFLFLGFGATLLGLGYWLNAPGAEEGSPGAAST